MSSLKIVVFPGLEEVSYTTEKKATLGNPVLEFLSEGSSVTQEQLYTIEQLASKQLESENRRYAKNSREFVCPPILDLAMTTRASELQPVNKPRRIFNGFFPSKIRTSNSCPNSTRDMKSKQVNILILRLFLNVCISHFRPKLIQHQFLLHELI